MNIRIIYIFLIHLIIAICNAQILPDSLIGTYIGQTWFKWEEDMNWTITVDTIYISQINNNCQVVAMANNIWFGGTWVRYETEYDFCQGNSINSYRRFHPTDSLTIIYDEVSYPPPYYHIQYNRFYGKKVSSDVPQGILSLGTVNKYFVYPNLFHDYIYIKFTRRDKYIIRLFTVKGVIAINDNLSYSIDHTIDTSGIPDGIYFLQILSNTSAQTFKLFKQ